MCVFTSSCNEVFARSARLAAVYLEDNVSPGARSADPTPTTPQTTHQQPEIAGHTTTQTRMKDLRRNLPNVHENAPHDRGAQTPRKRPQALIPRNAPQAPQRVRVVRPLRRRPRAVGAHADEDDLCRVPDDAREAAGQARGADGRPGGELACRGFGFQVLRQEGVEAEAGGGVG